ncbi:MAG: lipoprotein-releasing ABC transporter permease subunit [Psychromonas sp.]|nr:lipoprotein-releasing ABC transporter permease subunit [Psychromonas sp.]
MFYPLSLYIGLRYTKSKHNSKFASFVSLFSTAGIIVGVMALITVLSVMNGFQHELKTRILGAVPQVVISNKLGVMSHWQHKIKRFRQVKDVKAIEPLVTGQAIVQSKSGLQSVNFEGISPKNYNSNIIKDNIYVGSLKSLFSHSYHIIIGRSLAQTLSVHVGDKIRVTSTKGSRYTPFGVIPSQRNFTVSGIFNVGSEVDKYLILMNIEDAGRLIRIQKNQITGLRIYLNDAFDIQNWKRPALSEDQTIVDWRSTHGELFAAVRMEKNMIGLLLSLIVIVASFNILSSCVLVVNDKNSQIAILKTLGITRRTINLIFMIQGAWSGILGSIVGTVIGLTLSYYINQILSFLKFNLVLNASGGLRTLPVIFEPMQIIGIMFGAMLLSLLATLYPAYRSATICPVEALRYE